MTQHNSNEQKLEHNFELWCSGQELDEKDLVDLQMHPIWSERMLSFRSLELMATQTEFEQVEVPKWNRNAGFEQYLQQPSWWQTQGLSLVAFTFSIFACVIMLFDLRVNMSESGFTIATANQVQKLEMEQQFAQLAEKNNQQIQTRLDNFQANQQQSTAQLVSYVLNNSRIERQEDIQDMVSLIQQQRRDDLDYLKQQFSDINYNLRRAEFNNKRGYSDDDEAQITE